MENENTGRIIRRKKERTEAAPQMTVRRLLGRAADIFLAAGILVMSLAALWGYYFAVPCRVEEDLRGLGIDVARMMQWEKEEKDRESGILDMAGWRIERTAQIVSVSTGRKTTAGVIAVYGNAALVSPAGILSGDYALPAGTEAGACILTKDLSDALFGSTDTAGELIRIGDELLAVSGVIDKEGPTLLRASSEGPLEYAAFRISRRFRARQKAIMRIE